jgi:hypothetical protein
VGVNEECRLHTQPLQNVQHCRCSCKFVNHFLTFIEWIKLRQLDVLSLYIYRPNSPTEHKNIHEFFHNLRARKIYREIWKYVFLVPFNRSYVPTPYGAIHLLFKFRFHIKFFYFRISALVSLPCPHPGLKGKIFFYWFYIGNSWELRKLCEQFFCHTSICMSDGLPVRGYNSSRGKSNSPARLTG